MDRQTVILSAKRTPFGKYLGLVAGVDPVELACHAARAALAAAGVEAAALGQVFVGNCVPAAFQTPSVTGKQVALKLGSPAFTTTIDTACCSPLTALRLASLSIAAGDADLALVVGVDAMSRTPHLARNLRGGVRAGAVSMQDPIFPIEYAGYNSVAFDAAAGAEKHGVQKLDMDLWALRSHQKWHAAADGGRFADELAPLTVKDGRKETLVEEDESPRRELTLARLQALPPVFGTATITAGNAPGLNDGAAAMVVASAARARALGISPIGRVAGQAFATADPGGISWVPALAIRSLEERTGVPAGAATLVEINEAFAAVPLVSTRILAGGDEGAWLDLLARTNVNGGAVAIGHPVGASGLRILMTLVYELRRRGGGRGIAAICGGLAQGEAVLVEA